MNETHIKNMNIDQSEEESGPLTAESMTDWTFESSRVAGLQKGKHLGGCPMMLKLN